MTTLSESTPASQPSEKHKNAEPNQTRLALKLLFRDWKGGALTILVFSLLLAVATVTSISLFTSRIHNSIYDEATQLLAGDAKISGSMPIHEEWQGHAREQNIASSSVTEFATMAFSEQDMILSQVKAVDSHYPLKGSLTITQKGEKEGKLVQTGPSPGEVWIAARLLGALNIELGSTIQLGEADFKVTAIINKEPDSGQSLFGVAPRAMIHMDDLAKTEAVQTGSRIRYAMLIAGAESDINQYSEWVTPKLGHHFRWQDVKSNNRSIGDALNRAESFLLLAGSLSVILGGAAIALAARRYARKHNKTVALLKTLGCTPKNIVHIYSLTLLSLGLFAVIAGGIVGWGLHWGILIAIDDLIQTKLPLPSIDAYWVGGVTGLVALLAFAAPPILRLRNVMPIAAINENYQSNLSLIWTNMIGLFAVIGLVYFYSQNIKLTAYLLIGAIVCLAGVYVLSRATLILSKQLAPVLGYSWRLGLNNLQRHKQTNALQIMIFSILFLLVAILSSVRTHLLDQWQNQLPSNAANHFAFNIYPEELPDVTKLFIEAEIEHSPFYPMTRGRVIAVNGTDSQSLAEIYAEPDDRMDYQRELNLTYSKILGSDNAIEQGQWWDTIPADEHEKTLYVSAEQEYAKGLNIQLGDTVTFSIAGQEVDATVSSIRTVQWDSMNPNFFMIFNQPINAQFGANWLTSFYLPPEQKDFINQLSRQYPTISIIELDQTIEQIRDIIGKITSAIEFILMLVLASGILVLITSIQATLDMRFKESAILRTLGADRQLVRKTLLVEFATLGLLAGLLAVLGTEASLYMLQTQIFNLNYQPFKILWLLLPLTSTFIIAMAGWLSTRKVIKTPPMEVLKSIN